MAGDGTGPIRKRPGRAAQAALLTFCSLWAAASFGDGAPPREPVYLYYWGVESDTLALEVIQDFEARHDGSDGKPPVKVVMGQTASINNVDDPQRLLTAVAGGDPPDPHERG